MSDYLVVASTDIDRESEALAAMNMALELRHQGYGVSVVLLESEMAPPVQPEIIKRLGSLLRVGARVFTRWNFRHESSKDVRSSRSVSEAVIEAHRAAGDIVIWPVP